MKRLLFFALLALVCNDGQAESEISDMNTRTKSEKSQTADKSLASDDSSKSVFHKNFSEITISGDENGHPYVDLGLPSGIMWATTNIGATSPLDHGLYFSWGEIEMKEYNEPDNYKFVKKTYFDMEFLTKYLKSSSYKYDFKDFIDNKNELESVDDIAAIRWESSWRIPTTKDMQELIDGCEWTWVESFGGKKVSGRLGISKYNGNKIFLPTSGYRFYHSISSVYTYGHYWTSSICETDSRYATYMYFYAGYMGIDNAERYQGRVIRPVMEKKTNKKALQK